MKFFPVEKALCALMSVVSLYVFAADGIESDDGGAETVSSNAAEKFASPHLKVTAWELKDQTDAHNELVFKREWLLMPGEAPFTLSLNVLDVMDVTTGGGVVFVRKAPLPHARVDRRPDFRVVAGRPHSVEVLPCAYPCERIAYQGGVRGRHRALMAAQRRWRAYVPGRDGLLLSNTWGDRNRDSRLNEAFMMREIEAAAEIGVDVVQIDDGWQKGRTSNSSAAGGKGVWGGYWAADPEFWEVDPLRFPNGLSALAAAAAGRGISLGLWFGPDSSNDAANWERDAELLLRYRREYGVRHYKIDSMKSKSDLALANQRALFRKVMESSGGDVTFDLDVTAEIRPGYFGMPEIGPVFVENRYTDWVKYWPHQTLRNLWSLCEVVDPVRLRMEFLNIARNASKYGDDPLAPAKWTQDAVFATVMTASPLAWFEVSEMSKCSRDRLRTIVAKWKKERERIHSGVVFPVGSRPDGMSWTGFAVEAADGDGGYAVIFRDGAQSGGWRLDLNGILAAERCSVLSGEGSASLEGSVLSVSVPSRLGYVWVKLNRAD
jgi:alpha-galactosidase